MIPSLLPGALALLIAISSSLAIADTFRSGEQRVQLLELYTSEGCSSCPRADRWLSRMREDPRLWDSIVPIALHVDYWDYIGWTDPFADAAHSKRQRQYGRLGHLRSVYTPEFVFGGREWRGFFRRGALPEPQHEQPAAARLFLNIHHGNGTLEVVPAGPHLGRVALLGFDRNTKVPRGENAGRTLKHDFVALEIADTNEEGHFALSHACRSDQRYAIAAWIEAPGDPTPVQAVGGWLQTVSGCGSAPLTVSGIPLGTE